MSSRRGTSKGEEKALASKLFGNLGEAPLVADDDGADDGLFGKTPAASGGETERIHDDAGDDAPAAGVWEDPDDAKSTVNVARLARLRKLRTDEAETDLDGARYVARIRKQHRRLHQRTGWADIETSNAAKGAKGSKDPSALSHLLREGGAMVEEDGGLADKGRALPQGTLEATRVRDANAAEPSDAVLRSVAFHANGALFLTAGLDKTVRLFDIDGTNNPKVQGVFFEDLPIHKACFANGGAAVVAAGRRDYFYVYDLARGAVERVAPLVGRPEKSLESFAQSPDVGHHKNDPMLAFLGADGHVPLVSLKSRTCVGAVKMNGSARSAAFAADGVHLLTAGGDSTTYVWDLRNQKRCVEKIVDDGALTVTALAASPSGAHVAFGSESGVVNVYDTRGFRTFGSNLLRSGRRERKPTRPYTRRIQARDPPYASARAHEPHHVRGRVDVQRGRADVSDVVAAEARLPAFGAPAVVHGVFQLALLEDAAALRVVHGVLADGGVPGGGERQGEGAALPHPRVRHGGEGRVMR
jgi:U3 small nucleolar RNA-associated protein 18